MGSPSSCEETKPLTYDADDDEELQAFESDAEVQKNQPYRSFSWDRRLLVLMGIFAAGFSAGLSAGFILSSKMDNVNDVTPSEPHVDDSAILIAPSNEPWTPSSTAATSTSESSMTSKTTPVTTGEEHSIVAAATNPNTTDVGQGSGPPKKEFETITYNGQSYTVETESATWEDQADVDNDADAAILGDIGNPGGDHHEPTDFAPTVRFAEACPATRAERKQQGIPPNRVENFGFCSHSVLQAFGNATIAANPYNETALAHENIFSTMEYDYYPVGYMCLGDEYDQFGEDLHAYADGLVQGDDASRSPCWGKRPLPIPDNRTILITGNSHTKQMIKSMMCYAGLEKLTYLHVSFHKELITARYTNGATLVGLVNYPGMAANDLNAEIENVTGKPLNSYDAVVMGVFNTCKGGSSFAKEAASMMKGNPQYKFDECYTTRIPTFANMADLYGGPIMYVSMFATYTLDWAHEMEEEMVEYKSRFPGRTFVYQNGREHVHALQQECGAKARVGLSLCDNSKAGRKDHRCTGVHGGHPDLVAWEVTEFLYSLEADDLFYKHEEKNN